MASQKSMYEGKNSHAVVSAKHKQRKQKTMPITHVKLKWSPDNLKHAVKQLTALHTRCKAVAAASKGWTILASPDSKEDGLADFRAQAALVKGTLASVYGNKAVPFRLPVSTTFTATAGTGIVNTALTIRISDSTEYTSLSALFDEFRMKGGLFEFFLPAPTSTVVLGTSSLTYDACMAIGFDPADSTSATTARGVTELNQHHQVFPRMSMTPTVGTYVGLFGREDNKPYRFKWSAQAVELMTDSAGNVTTVGQWKGTAAVPQSDGFLKPYFQSGFTTAVAAILGTNYFECEFRSRT